MHFLMLPTEIRLKIYSELLVSTERISLLTILGNETWVSPTNANLTVGLLRTCKQVYREAIEILYTRNCFAVSADAPTTERKRKTVNTFLGQIGSRASLIRHVFSELPYELLDKNFQAKHFEGDNFDESCLAELRPTFPPEAFPGVTNLELFFPFDRDGFALRQPRVFYKLVDAVQKTMVDGFPALQKVAVQFELYESVWGFGDQEEEARTGQQAPYQLSMAHLYVRGWAVKVKRIPINNERFMGDFSHGNLSDVLDQFDFDMFLSENDFQFGMGIGHDGEGSVFTDGI